MLKVLIADDEVKVCKLICCLIDWSSLGMEITGVVHNGEEALEFIKDRQPDIVITDIRMPETNGLDLIQQAKEWNENINFIIISGYNHFEYAQNAIKFGVEDYILKPIKKKELLLSLNKIIEKQNALEESACEKESLIQRIHTDTSKTRASFMTRILQPDSNSPPLTCLEEINTQYYCNFNGEFYQMMIIQPIFYEQIEEETLNTFFTAKVSNLITSIFHYFQELIVTGKREIVYCLFNGSQENMQYLKRELKQLRKTIMDLQDVFVKMKVYIFTSNLHTGIESLPLCVEEAVHASYDKLITFNSIVEYHGTAESANVADFLTVQLRKNFLSAIETLDTASLTLIIETLSKTLQQSTANGKLIYDVYHELLNIFSYGIKSFNYAINYETIITDLLNEFNYFTSIHDLMSNLLSVMQQSLEDYQNQKSLENTRPIRMAKQYINTYYYKPLTLEMIGKEIGLNPSYFSSIFKKETGISFVDYLNEIRIEHAKHLLLQNHRSISQICEAVGYHDMKYFTKRFKKSTGLSPTDYLKLYS